MKSFRKRTALAYLSSSLLHIGIVISALLLAAPDWAEITTREGTVQTTVRNHLRNAAPSQTLDVNIDSASLPEDEPLSTDRTAVESVPTQNSPGIAAFAQRRLDLARSETEGQSPETQRSELEKLGRQLNNVASEESVEEVSETLSNWLGAEKRAEASSSPPVDDSGTFDVDTAQIAEVNKIETGGATTYVAVLVDADGHRSETVLDDADGSQLYETFQLIKRFPLMETIYRRTVMGLLDKLAREQTSATQVSHGEPSAQSESEAK